MLLFTGVALTRIEGFELQRIRNLRSASYWFHVPTPFMCVWLYVLHRLAGPRIRWKVDYPGAARPFWPLEWLLFCTSTIPVDGMSRHRGEKYFQPSGAAPPARKFHSRQDGETMNTPPVSSDSYKSWFHSSHHFSSFNNPVYLFAVNETRRVSLQRDGTVQASRWCAGCHDPRPSSAVRLTIRSST